MTEKEIRLSVNNEIIAGTVFTPKENSRQTYPAVVFFHGARRNRKEYVKQAKALEEQGIIAVIFDFRGCGESKGEFNLESSLEDGKVIVDFLQTQQNINAQKTGIFAYSLGGALATTIAAERSNITSLFLDAPSIYHSSWVEIPSRKIVINDDDSFHSKGINLVANPLEAIEYYGKDLFIIKHEADTVVHPALVDAYNDRAKSARIKNYKTIADAEHTLNEDQENQLRPLLVDWFRHTLK